MNSYSLRKPVPEKKTHTNKRSRKNESMPFINNCSVNNTNTNISFFEYNCFNCNEKQTLPTELMDNFEIECSSCGCRIFRKPRIQKKLEISAV